MCSFKIREIQPKDNQSVAKVVRKVLTEMGVPKVGTAYEDKSLDDMFATYDHDKMEYFVVVEEGEIIGGAGIGPLLNGDESVCELQKMYFLPVARGRGIGAAMMNTCLHYAKAKGYDQCYLETLPYMEDARRLYNRSGFQSLEKPMGDTGHYNCTMWMLKDLD
tara:strand:+ start:323 stop:811 length:489 start_codon:yes stop_codon:yes gene_type:complete